METRLLVRNGEQLLLAVVIPLIVLVGGIFAAERVRPDVLAQPRGHADAGHPGAGGDVDELHLAGDRHRLRAQVRRAQAARLLTAPPVRAARRQGRRPARRRGAPVRRDRRRGPGARLVPVRCRRPGCSGWSLTALLGTAAFASLGLFLAGALRAEATLAAANLVYLLLMAGGAVVFPADSYGSAGPVLALLPSGALGDGHAHGVPRRGRSPSYPCSCWPAGPSSAPHSPRGPSRGSDSGLVRVHLFDQQRGHWRPTFADGTSRDRQHDAPLPQHQHPRGQQRRRLPGRHLRRLDEQLADTYKRVGLRPGLLERLVGIRERRWWPDGVTFVDGAAMAGAKAIGESGIDPADIGLMVNTSVSRHHLEPSTAVAVHDALGLPPSCQNFDVTNACLGFVNGMELAGVDDRRRLHRLRPGRRRRGRPDRPGGDDRPAARPRHHGQAT